MTKLKIISGGAERRVSGMTYVFFLEFLLCDVFRRVSAMQHSFIINPRVVGLVGRPATMLHVAPGSEVLLFETVHPVRRTP